MNGLLCWRGLCHVPSTAWIPHHIVNMALGPQVLTVVSHWIRISQDSFTDMCNPAEDLCCNCLCSPLQVLVTGSQCADCTQLSGCESFWCSNWAHAQQQEQHFTKRKDCYTMWFFSVWLISITGKWVHGIATNFPSLSGTTVKHFNMCCRRWTDFIYITLYIVIGHVRYRASNKDIESKCLMRDFFSLWTTRLILNYHLIYNLNTNNFSQQQNQTWR